MSQIILVGKGRPEYGYQAGTNTILPGNISLMEWNVYKKADRKNARKQKKEMQTERIMEQINNEEESRNAKGQQKKDLDLANMAHPEISRLRSARNREIKFNKRFSKSAPSKAGKTTTAENKNSLPVDNAIIQDAQLATSQIDDGLKINIRNMLDS
jgi:hypothetical protein